MPRPLREAFACPHAGKADPPCGECLSAARHALAAIAFLLTEYEDVQVTVDGKPMELRHVAEMLNAFSAGVRPS